LRKLIVSEFLTLDGVMESPEKWQSPYLSDDLLEIIQAQMLAYGAMLLGRVTYEEFAAYWPSQTHNEFGIADKMNSMPKLVVSSTLGKTEWHNSTLIKENVAEAITKLKQQAGEDIQVTGSATLVQSLMQADLIDEYRLMIHPVVVGSGKRLFKDGMVATPLKLVETKTLSSGIVVLTYLPNRKEEPS
jgi:dihydrofolate reductase